MTRETISKVELPPMHQTSLPFNKNFQKQIFMV